MYPLHQLFNLYELFSYNIYSSLAILLTPPGKKKQKNKNLLLVTKNRVDLALNMKKKRCIVSANYKIVILLGESY
jgi:hypothetical protein